jgi:hypothetical protein
VQGHSVQEAIISEKLYGDGTYGDAMSRDHFFRRGAYDVTITFLTTLLPHITGCNPTSVRCNGSAKNVVYLILKIFIMNQRRGTEEGADQPAAIES